MPVIVVVAPDLGSADEESRALGDIAAAVADALALQPDDVVVSCVHSVTGVVGRRAAAPWPLVVLHGRPRPAEHMAEAERRAREQVARAWQRPLDEVWAEWSVS